MDAGRELANRELEQDDIRPKGQQAARGVQHLLKRLIEGTDVALEAQALEGGRHLDIIGKWLHRVVAQVPDTEIRLALTAPESAVDQVEISGSEAFPWVPEERDSGERRLQFGPRRGRFDGLLEIGVHDARTIGKTAQQVNARAWQNSI